MGYCILPDGGLGVLSTILEVGLTSPSRTGRNDNEWLPCSALLRRWRRAPIARVPSAGPLGAKTTPPDHGSQRGVHLGPGSPGCTCQGIKAPCDGLSVCPPVLSVLVVQPVTPSCRGPREEKTGPREVRSQIRETRPRRKGDRQSMRSACARDQREGATCGTARNCTYIGHM